MIWKIFTISSIKKKGKMMAYVNEPFSGEDNNFAIVKQAQGKVLGRLRYEVKSSMPSAGVKDYRFFADPLSPVPSEYENAVKFGFTGFMSRLDCKFDEIKNEEEAVQFLKENYKDCLVTFTPALRNNKFFVLDDLQKEGKTLFMDTDKDYVPVPVFGTVEHPVFGGNINKFCFHMKEGKPLPGLSKKYWDNEMEPEFVIATMKTYEGKIGPYIIFAPLYNDVFNSEVIGEGGAYFKSKRNSALGYALYDMQNTELKNHVLRCAKSPLWFIPREYLPEFRKNLKPVPQDGDILKDLGIEIIHDPIFLPAKENVLKIEETLADMVKNNNKENEIKTEDKKYDEKDFIKHLIKSSKDMGFLYSEKDLINFHISMKSSRLVILSGMSGIGKSGLVRTYGKALGLPKERTVLIPVRPSWMDDGDLLGYVDMKNMIYRPADTGLSELLIDAEKNPEKLYIICFDEMNLARAEHYFAQFISVLENEEEMKIRLYNPSLATRIYNSNQYPPEITIGNNIMFVGTVNVDESTYKFSDKILDRSNVITLKQGKFVNLSNVRNSKDINSREISATEFNTFRKTGDIELTEEELKFLDELNDSFYESGIMCGIGFRVAKQLDNYLKNIPDKINFTRKEGIDVQTVQRILTKIHGSSQQLKTLIDHDEEGNLTGKIAQVLDKYKNISMFEETRRVLKEKSGELKFYDYTL